MKRALSFAATALLVLLMTFQALPFVLQPAYADEKVIEGVEPRESGLHESSETEAVDSISSEPADVNEASSTPATVSMDISKIEFVYIDRSVVSIGEEQHIAIGFKD